MLESQIEEQTIPALNTLKCITDWQHIHKDLRKQFQEKIQQYAHTES